MTAVRRTLAFAAASGLAAVAGIVPAQPALAHGATTQPISRTAACTPGSRDYSTSAACKAASAANGRPFGNFDNLRVPGVAGRDKQYIPDGNLCSGDLPEFAGLDLARADWPATRVTAGQRIDIRYATTIPHRGKFRVYLTKVGFDPGRPLGWDDLSAQPIITATDPPVRDGAYRFSGKLPADRSGRHVLYVVWETTSTPDTYYSCSDLIVKAPAGAAAPAGTTAGRAGPQASRSPEPGAVVQPAEAAGPVSGAGAPAAEESWLTRAGDSDRVAVGEQIVSTAVIVLVGVGAALAYLRLRRRRPVQQIHRRFEKR
jgi:predicted carbohydrate-binding protein with CBM5 and CBM33 domain